MSTSLSRRRRRGRIKVSSRQAGYVVAALLIMVVAGRAGGGAAATWWDALAVGVAMAVLSVALAWPRRRRRSSSTVYRRPSTQRVDNQVLGGGHSAWSAPAGKAVVVGSASVRMRKPQSLGKQRMRLAVAEELLEAHGLTADYRAMVSAVEQDAS
jgi:hypothetical protein